VHANYKTETDMKASAENLNTLGEQPKPIETVQNLHVNSSKFQSAMNALKKSNMHQIFIRRTLGCVGGLYYVVRGGRSGT
jgi:hypothetical protein